MAMTCSPHSGGATSGMLPTGAGSRRASSSAHAHATDANDEGLIGDATPEDCAREWGFEQEEDEEVDFRQK
jgi:hypothetical protein